MHRPTLFLVHASIHKYLHVPNVNSWNLSHANDFAKMWLMLVFFIYTHTHSQGLAVSPGHEYAVATTRDNAVTLVGLAGKHLSGGVPY